MLMIEAHNQEYELGIHTYELGMNHLGDMTKEEIVGNTRGFRPVTYAELNNTFHPESGSRNASLDYRKKGYVTSVKNQLPCSSCGWAFSAVGALEGQLAMTRKNMVALSAQNLLDCVQKESVEMELKLAYAFMYARDNGIASEKAYPYKHMKDAKCMYHNSMKAITCRDFMTFQPESESVLADNLNMNGPMSVGFDASQPAFQFYKSGTYSDFYCNPDKLTHALLLVGYTPDAWIVKNSWGETWGDSGYVYVEREKNTCGIANFASVPVCDDFKETNKP
ncbi:cathepsin K-like [Engraulis encrasicolus]|uniref:cathepsin K-like n=1 Tax=Engraulis encrasicolus TaxID=184585 RepID=UPI002FD54814